MGTVWAYKEGFWTKDRKTGWADTIHMTGLADLCDSLEHLKLRGAVPRLAIVAHGNEPGVVQLDRKLSLSSLANFAPDFARLKPYLADKAFLEFYACIAGKDEPGSRLLVALSQIFPGCTIVGFELYGLIGPEGSNNAPGEMDAIQNEFSLFGKTPRPQLGRLDPWCRWAKRARYGQIVHLPALEQANRKLMKCANPLCPGHREPTDSCPGW
jgi:hypothetical protein